MSEFFTDIGARIKERLKANNVTQNQLSDFTNLSPMSISQYVNDKRIPDTPSAYKIAKALDVTIEWLLTGENAPFNDDKDLSSLNLKEAHIIKMYRSFDEKDKENAFDMIKLYSFLNKNDKEETLAIIKLKHNRQRSSSED